MSQKGVNQVTIIGNVGADPGIRELPNGEKVVTLRIATSESFKDKDSGEQKEITEWHTIVIYKPLAEIASQYVKKGSKVYILGKLKTRSWKDKDGATKYATEIIAKEMQMLDSKSIEAGNAPSANKTEYSVRQKSFNDDVGF